MVRNGTPNEAARQWLIENDPGSADYWCSLPSTADFIGPYRDSTRELGPENIQPAPLAIPGMMYRLTGTRQCIIVESLAHSQTFQNREVVVYYHPSADPLGGPDTALRYYMALWDFERNYVMEE